MNPRPFLSLRGMFAALAAVLPVHHGLAVDPDPPMSVIEFGSSWKYWDSGTVPPAIGGVASWNAVAPVAYDAEAVGSPWKTGFGLFGYGDNAPYGQGGAIAKSITTYFWKKFQLPQGMSYTPNATAVGPQFKSFELGIMRDDAVVVWVNNEEKLLNVIDGTRDNLPSSPTVIGNTTLASSPLDGDSETTILTSNYSGSSLKAYPEFNYIGVELHQSSANNLDARFNLYLNLTDADPCYGAAKPGIKAIFNVAGTDVPTTPPTTLHLREPLGEPPFDLQDTDMNWKSTNPTGGALYGGTGIDLVNGEPLPSNALSILGNGTYQWDSEPIDVRNFTNVIVTAKVQAIKGPAVVNYNSGDKIEFTLRYSGDGASYRDLLWQSISTSVAPTGTVWTDVVAESAVKKAIVPTSSSDPLNVGANNWRTRGFDDAPWPSGTKGAGYENSPTDSVNYTDLLDGNFNFQTQLFGANPKKSVAYMRCTFPAQPNRDTFTKFQLRMKYDDGFIAYLNDVEVARKNVAAGVLPANITPTTLASAGNADNNAVLYEDIDITSKKANIDMAQTNVLAIYVLNTPAESSDMIVWPVLQMGKAGGPAPITLASIDDGNSLTYTEISTATAGAGNTSLIPPGTQAIKIRFKGTIANDPLTAFSKAFYFDDIFVTGAPIEGDSYESFIKVKAPTASPADLDAAADIDGDSISNICEYAFGSDPTVPALVTPDLRAGASLGDTVPISPVVSYTDAQGYVVVKFRMPAGNITGNAGEGFEIMDLNIRPQMSFGEFSYTGWQDAVSGTSKFIKTGGFEANNDGTVTVTCQSLDPVHLLEKQVYVRVRVGVNYPGYLAGQDASCPF